MPDPLYSPSSDFDQGVAQDAISGLQETPVSEFFHPLQIASETKLGHVKSGGDVSVDEFGIMHVQSATSKIKMQDFDSGISYCGTAPSGTAQNLNVWSLTKIEISPAGATTVTHAVDSWTNHLTANYN